MRKEIKQCSSLDEVRSNIDQIDKQLISLIAERSNYVDQASQFKKNMQDVADSQRVETIIAKMKNLAVEHDLDTIIIEKIYRTMIGAFIEYEAQQVSPIYREVKQSYY